MPFGEQLSFILCSCYKVVTIRTIYSESWIWIPVCPCLNKRKISIDVQVISVNVTVTLTGSLKIISYDFQTSFPTFSLSLSIISGLLLNYLSRWSGNTSHLTLVLFLYGSVGQGQGHNGSFYKLFVKLILSFSSLKQGR